MEHGTGLRIIVLVADKVVYLSLAIWDRRDIGKRDVHGNLSVH